MTPHPPISTLFPYTTLFRSVKLLTGKIADACQDGRQEAQARGEIPPEPEEREFLETPRYEEIEEYLEDEEDYLPTVSEEEFIGGRTGDEEAGRWPGFRWSA